MRHSKRQYTIRSVPAHLDQVLRQRAKQSGKSFNQVALDALTEGAGAHRRAFEDLDFMIGSLSEEEARDLEKEIALQRRIDPDLWR